MPSVPGIICQGRGWRSRLLLPLPSLRYRLVVESPEFSVGDVAGKDTCVFFFALGLELGTSCSFRPSPGLSVRDVVEAAGVGGRRALELYTGVAGGRERGYSILVISLVLSPGLSIRDVGEAVGGDVVLTPILVAGMVGGSVRGVASTVRSLKMSPELSVGDVGKASVGARLAPKLSVGGVEICAL